MTAEMTFLASFVAIVEYLNYAGLIAANIYSMAMAFCVCFVYIIFCVKRNGISYNEFFILLCSLAFVILNRDLSSFSIGLAWIIYFVLTGSITDKTRIMKHYAGAAVTCFCLIVFASFFGLNASANAPYWRIDRIIYRISIGFAQPNSGMMCFLGIAISLIFLSKNIRRDALLIAIPTALIYYFTLSRTSGYVVFLLLAICLILGEKVYGQSIKFERALTLVISPIFYVISYLLLRLPINAELDQLLTGRITIYQNIYNSFGIHLIGNPLVKNYTLDSGYLQSLMAKGILLTIFLFISFNRMMISRASRAGRFACLAICIFFLISFTEASFLRFIILFPVLVICSPRYSKEDNGSLELERESNEHA